MVSRLILVLVFALFVCASSQGAPEMSLDGILIGLKPGTDAARYFSEDFSRVTTFRGLTNSYYLLVNAAGEEQILAECARRKMDPEVRYAEPDWLLDVGPRLPPGDPSSVVMQPPPLAAGAYVAFARVRRSLAPGGLLTTQTIQGTARVAEGGTLTILLASPLDVPASRADSSVLVAKPLAQPGNNFLAGQTAATVTVSAQGAIKLTYSVAKSIEDSPETTLQTTVEFTLRPRLGRAPAARSAR